MQNFITLINQIFEIEQKIVQENISENFDRNFRRIQNTFEETGFWILNPLGEKYSESRTDYEANIVGNPKNNMTISKVIKPIIYKQSGEERTLIQKGIVIVE